MIQKQPNTPLTQEQIEEWRRKIKDKIFSDFCGEPNEAHGKTLQASFDALCDMALRSLPASEMSAHTDAAPQATTDSAREGQCGAVSPAVAAPNVEKAGEPTGDPHPLDGCGNDKPLQPLNCDRDAARWAREFNESLSNSHGIELDEGRLIGWFANAMMCGEDTYRWRKEAEARTARSEKQATEEVRERMQLALDEAWAGIHARDAEIASLRSTAQSATRESIVRECAAKAAKKSEFVMPGGADDAEYWRGYAKGREEAAQEVMTALADSGAKNG